MSALRTLILIGFHIIMISFTSCSCRGLMFPDQTSLDITPTPEIIRRYGYPAETHSVITDDGYILELHRIPHGKNRKADPQKKPVFLQHGLLTTSGSWVLRGPNISLGFLLADKGYDVWLGNIRGNTYSRRHVKYSPNQLQFWNFSFHEIGVYDVPAFIDFILKETKQDKVTYIGHSMGTTIFYVMVSMRPEYNEKILVQLSLAPVAYLGHISSPFINLVALYDAEIDKMVTTLFNGEVFSRSPRSNSLLKLLCTLSKQQKMMCLMFLRPIFGFTDQLDHTIIPYFFGHDPAGTSMKLLVHFAQLINNPNQFRQFDYGPLHNVHHYNSSVQPDYNVSAITAKVALFYGPNDMLSDVKDVKRLYSQLPNPIGIFKVKNFSHLDFLYAKDVRNLLNNRLIKIIESENRLHFNHTYQSRNRLHFNQR